MTLLRRALALSLALGAAACVPGGPQRASDIQNLNAISDDIAAVSMTRSDTSHVRDPNMHSTIPRTYEIHDVR